jgi:hypothetical protein
MQGLELFSVSAIFFVAYLYLPLALFRFGAEQRVDIRRNPDSSPLADFIDAAIPSAALHVATWSVLWFAARMPLLRRLIASPAVDWRLVAAFIAGDDKPYLRTTVITNHVATVVYFVTLIVVSGVFGLIFGGTVIRRLSAPEMQLRDRAPSRPPVEWWGRGTRWRVVTVTAWAALPVRLAWFAIVEIVCAAVWKTSNCLVPEQTVWLFRWSVRQPTVFVRTRGNRLYFGKFKSYEKLRDGKIDTVTITNVWRYCYDDVSATLNEGRLPLSFFGGPLTILWHEVADIHEADETHFGGLYGRYLAARETHLDRTLLDGFAGQTISADDVYRRRAGGDLFTRTDITDALDRLTEKGVIDISAGAGGTSIEYRFPLRVGVPEKPSSPPPESEIDAKIASAVGIADRLVQLAVRKDRRRSLFMDRRRKARRRTDRARNAATSRIGDGNGHADEGNESVDTPEAAATAPDDGGGRS